MVFYPKDYGFGIKEEERILSVLKKFFNKDIKQSEDPMAKHDFYDEYCNYELKSRTHFYGRYNDTMITENKICGNKKLILLFNFTDGLYYIEYDKEKFASYRREDFSRADIEWDKKIHVYIPIKDLSNIETKCLLKF